MHFQPYTLLKEFPELIQGTFTRKGGFSKKPFTSLNLSFEVGDQKEAVLANRQAVKEYLKIPYLIDPLQCHSDQFFVVTNPYEIIPPCDALITQQSQIALLIKHADCQACLIYDPVKQVIANIHAGWRGLVKKIYTQVIQQLITQFQSQPQNLGVCISPSLGPQASEFIHFRQEFPPFLWPFEEQPNHFNLWRAAVAELKSLGILEQHMEIAKECTYEKKEHYFSYRRDKLTGRLGTVIGFK